MNKNDIFDFFEKFGILTSIDDNKVTFFDKESEKEIKASYLENFQGHLLPSFLVAGDVAEKKKSLILIDDIKNDNVVLLSVPGKKSLVIHLSYPRINQIPDKQSVIIDEAFYSVMDGTNLQTDYFNIDNMGGHNDLTIITNCSHDNSYKIKIEGDKYIEFDAGGIKTGLYCDGSFKAGLLKDDEVYEMFDSMKIIPTVISYYDKIYPEFANNIEKFNENRKTIKH